MAATATHKAASGDTTALAAYPSASFSPAIGDLLVVVASVSGSVAVGSCTSSTGGTFTQIATALKATSGDTLYLYVANALTTTTTARTVSVSVSGDNGTGATVHVCALTGIDGLGAAAVRQFKVASNQFAATTPTLNFDSTTLTTNLILGFMANGTNPAGFTVPTNFTQMAEAGYDTPSHGSKYAVRTSGHASTTVTFGNSASGWGAIIAEFNVAAAVGTTAWKGYTASGLVDLTLSVPV